MKNIKLHLSIILSLVFVLSSCETYLDQDSPDRTTTDQVWISYDAAESYLISAYSYLQADGWRYHEYYYLPQNFRADDMFPKSGTTTYGYLADIVGFNNTAASSVPTYLWSNWYIGVKLANDVIENVATMDMISDEEKNQLIGEARFLRAFFFFNLQKNFHTIVMPTSVATTPDDLQIPAATADEVYAQVEADLIFATENLSATSESVNLASRNAAFALLGKAYLYQEKYQEAIDAFDEIEDCQLVDGADYRSMFDGTLEQNSECIFSAGYTSDQQEILGLYHQLAVAFAPADLRGGWEMVNISDYYVSQLESGDIRKEATVLQSGDTFDGELITFSDPSYNMCIKYVESLDAITDNRSTVDIVLIRYADVLLMRAEANYELGNTADALADVNEIRERAGLGAASLSGTALRDEIRKQRMIELVGEGHRFYDIVRWGIAEEQLQEAGQPFAANFDTKYEYFPVPLEETQRNDLIDPTPGF